MMVFWQISSRPMYSSPHKGLWSLGILAWVGTSARRLPRLTVWLVLRITWVPKGSAKPVTISKATFGLSVVFYTKCDHHKNYQLTFRFFTQHLFQMAALHSPFYGDKMNLYSLCQKIAHCEYPPIPSDIYSIHMRKLIDQCICSNPDQRPDTSVILQVASEQHHRCQTSQ